MPMPYRGFTITGGQCLLSLQHRLRSGHAVRSIGSDIIRPLEQWEYQDRLHRSRPCVRELEAALDREPSPAGRTETAARDARKRPSTPRLSRTVMPGRLFCISTAPRIQIARRLPEHCELASYWRELGAWSDGGRRWFRPITSDKSCSPSWAAQQRGGA